MKLKRYIIFVHGVYREREITFYRNLIRGKISIAVDGGYALFRKAGLFPDVLLGDFDSLKKVPAHLPETTTVLRFPSDKDKTDVHLALDYAVHNGAKKIDIVMPDVGEIDQFLGNVLLLAHPFLATEGKHIAQVRVVNARYEIRLVYNRSVTFLNCKGSKVSILPLSSKIVLDSRGMLYDARGVRIGIGDSRGLRNIVTAERATLRIQGKALVVHYFKR